MKSRLPSPPLILHFLRVAACCWFACASVILKEPLQDKRNLPHAAVIIVQTSEIPNERYISLASYVQTETDLCLWVAIPQFPENEPVPSSFDNTMGDSISQLHQAGLDTNGSVFVAGHGVGGISLQDWIAERAGTTKWKLKGQVLLGSYLQRKFRGSPYPLATLTLGGELDGVTRVTRLAEAYWHQVLRQTATEAARFPVVVLPGVSHMQFASGAAPPVIKLKDLKPETSDTAAHGMMATAMASFMLSQHGPVSAETYKSASGSHSRSESYTALQSFTAELLNPIIWAFVEEGYYHLKPPCYEISNGSECFFGSAWSSQAQRIMSGLVESKNITDLVDVDRLWPVNRIFPHDYLPKILNQCGETAGCVLNTTTVTQNVYSKLNVDDTTIDPVSALQMEVKLSSRQRCFEHAAVAPAVFNSTDTDLNCGQINMASYLTAIERAAPSAKARFLRTGQKMTMAKDKVIVIYPLWSADGLVINAMGQVATVTSVAMKFSTSNPIPLLSGLHFCKLLSPALAMEWVYIDGLRRNHSLSTGYFTTDRYHRPE